MEYYRFAKLDWRSFLSYSQKKNNFQKKTNIEKLDVFVGETYWWYAQNSPMIACFCCWFDVNQPNFYKDMRKKTIFAFAFPVTLTFDFLISKLFHHSGVTSHKIWIFKAFQYWVNERYARYVTHVCWWNHEMYSTMCIEWTDDCFDLGLT